MIGKVVTLQQASSIGGISIAELINVLRAEVGQEIYDVSGDAGEINFNLPGWFDPARVKDRFNATVFVPGDMLI
jgi:hypothetical protein